MSEWQPIETAPKDGTMILVWDESSSPGVVAAYFLSETHDDEEWSGWIYGDQLLADADPEGPLPTHWMPLPEPPK